MNGGGRGAGPGTACRYCLRTAMPGFCDTNMEIRVNFLAQILALKIPQGLAGGLTEHSTKCPTECLAGKLPERFSPLGGGSSKPTMHSRTPTEGG